MSAALSVDESAASGTSQTRDVVCRDARVRVTETGTGKPLVLLHDFLSDRGEWDPVTAALAARFRVLSVDLPGFGESEKPTPGRFGYDLDRFAKALVEVAGALDAAPCSIIGHGLGAAIAMAIAEKHPPLVERLVVVAPPLFGAKPVSFSSALETPVVGPVVGAGLLISAATAALGATV